MVSISFCCGKSDTCSRLSTSFMWVPLLACPAVLPALLGKPAVAPEPTFWHGRSSRVGRAKRAPPARNTLGLVGLASLDPPYRCFRNRNPLQPYHADRDDGGRPYGGRAGQGYRQGRSRHVEEATFHELGCHCWLVQQCYSGVPATHCWTSQQWHPGPMYRGPPDGRPSAAERRNHAALASRPPGA